MCVAALAQAQVGPSISYRMSPAHSVALDTDIIATITLDGLHPTSYSSVIFRADLTRKTTIHTTPETRCNGDDTGRDIDIAVNATTETFTAGPIDDCLASYSTYGSYTVDLTINREDTGAPGGRLVQLATTQTAIAMTRPWALTR